MVTVVVGVVVVGVTVVGGVVLSPLMRRARRLFGPLDVLGLTR